MQWIAALLILVLMGCGKDAKPSDEGVNTLERLKKKACECRDATCADAVEKDLQAAASTKTRDMKEVKRLGGEIMVCLRNAQGTSIGEAFGIDEGIETLRRIKDTACACSDAVCVEGVQKDLEAAAALKTKDLLTAKQIGGEIAACLRKVTEATMASPNADEGILALEGIKRRACLCQDMSCVEEVQKQLGTAASLRTKDPDKAKQIGSEIVECIQKVPAAAAK